MRAQDELQTVSPVEVLYGVPAEKVTGPSVTDDEPVDVVRVTPQQITHCALGRDLHLSLQLVDRVNGREIRGKTAVHAENPILDDRSQRQAVKHLSAVLPHIHATVLTNALVVEAINLGYLAGFVITTDEMDPARVATLERNQKQESLNTEKSTVHKITHKNVVSMRYIASYPQKFL